MYKRLGLILLASLILVAAIGISVSLASDSDGFFDITLKLTPFTQGHQNSGTVKATTCGRCHAFASGYNAHATHFRTLLLAFRDNSSTTVQHDGCGRCHSEGVDPNYEGDLSYAGQGAGKKARKQVSQKICLRCHGEFISTGIVHAGSSVTVNTNCLTAACHVKANLTGAKGGPAAHSAASVTWVNRTVVDNTASWRICTLCHGQDGSSGAITDRTFFVTTETNYTTWPTTTTP